MCQPAAPAASTTIQQQTDSNKQTAVAQQNLNLINQTDASGNSLNYQQIGTWADGTPRYSATQSLSAAGQQLQNTNQGTQQNLANLAQQQSGRLGSLLNAPLDFSSAPAAGQTPGLATSFGSGGAIQNSLGADDFSADRQRVEDALFSRLQPQLDRDQQAFETSLINKGIRPGSTQYNAEMQRNQMGINDQRTSVLLGAGQEQNRLQQLALNAGNFNNQAQAQQFGQNASAATFGNNALQQNFNNQNTSRANSLNELLTQRQVPLNELLAVAGQGQVQTPQFANTPSTSLAGVDTAGINQQAFANQTGQYNQNQNLLGGLFSAGASLLPLLSDRRTKTEIRRIGYADNGLPIYAYRYINGDTTQIGMLADEVEALHPEAVVTGTDGFKRVIYNLAVN